MDTVPTTTESESGLEQRSWPPGQLIVISANSFWNIVNFRRVLIDALIQRGYRLVVATPQSDQNWADERGVTAASLRIARSSLNPLKDLRLFIEYLQLFENHRPEFYFGFTVKPNIYGSIAARLMGVKAVPNVSGLGTAFMSDGLLSRLVGWLYRVAFGDCGTVFFQNPDDLELFVRRKIVGPDQARLLPGSGIDLKHFTPAGQEPSVPTFLFVGRLLGDKGVREFVEAARILHGEKPDWKFQLLGPVDTGNRTAISHEELDRWIEEGVVEYLGTSEDVRPFIAAATAVVLPSYREGLPRSLLEGAAMARPLVATDVPGNRQIVQHGVNGLLCEVRAPRLLADAMRAVARKSTSERQQMGRAGRLLVENFFAEERVISAYMDAMERPGEAGGV